MKTFINILLLANFNLLAAVAPYDSIKLLPLDMHGWFSPENERMLKSFIDKKNPQIVVELGTWLGKSAIFMASKLSKTARLYAIDLWTTTPEYAVIPEAQPRLSILYQQFLSNVIHHKLTNIIIPIKLTTLEAANKLQINPDLLYIDASHAEIDVYNDIMAWYPKLSPNGICCGDDWAFDPVKKGVRHAALNLGLNIKSEGNFWYFDFN